MNECLVCKKPAAKKYCSRACYNIGRIGHKRPDVTKRNLLDNPLKNPEALEKMRNSKIGKLASAETKAKMSAS